MKEVVPQILVVDDDEVICNLLSLLMEKEGFEPVIAYDGDSALKTLRLKKPDLMFLDFRMPGMDGMEVLKQAQELEPDLPVIMITGYADVPGAVEAIRAGAYDYLSKPFQHHDLIRIVHRALSAKELKLRVRNLTAEVKKNSPLWVKMGPSEAVRQLSSLINCVAESDYTVIIQGETGSGKEIVARAIHNSSRRSQCAFVAVDCGAIPETLLESELFGHEKGAFTDATFQRHGKFEMAEKGTLFLDEISNMPLNSQIKLLRVLQEKKVYRLGASKATVIDVRLVVASNQDLRTLAESGVFRRDLFYRLNEFTITVPPLRERKEDIHYLAKCFLDITNAELNKHVKGFSESALAVMLEYAWPGNVRELKSMVRRAVLLTDDFITQKHLDIKTASLSDRAVRPKFHEFPSKNLSFKDILRQGIRALEREVLIQALKDSGGNKAKAARMLQIDYKTIHTKIKQLRISLYGGRNE